jgi:hypothetical protein
MDKMLLLLKRLTDNQVDYVLVGGYAAIAHGSSLITKDVDVCAPLGEPNLSRILSALREINPRLRMRPDRMRLPEDPTSLRGLKNLYLLTDLGQIDFLGDLPGVGTFEDAVRNSTLTDLGLVKCLVLNLDNIIAAKMLAGRPKDLRGIAELEAARKRKKEQPDLFGPDS